MGSEDLTREMLEYLLKDVDRRNEDQKDRLKPIESKHGYFVSLGKDVTHHDKREPREDVQQAKREIYTSTKLEILDELIENWDDKEKRKRLLKDERDIELGRAMAGGIKGSSRADEHISKDKGIEL